MSQINQSVKVAPPLAKSNGQGVAALSLMTLAEILPVCLLSSFQW
ncbi:MULTISPECIES: hypothetical protein [Xenorhabdus]|nr:MULTISPECIES: hypothetical protein [Xenorhabdus]